MPAGGMASEWAEEEQRAGYIGGMATEWAEEEQGVRDIDRHRQAAQWINKIGENAAQCRKLPSVRDC